MKPWLPILGIFVLTACVGPASPGAAPATPSATPTAASTPVGDTPTSTPTPPPAKATSPSTATAQKQATRTRPPAPHEIHRIVDENCSSESCLFVSEAYPDYPVGSATVTGYYVQLERTVFDETRQCDSFTITVGPPALVRSILSLIEKGNAVYVQNDSGQPIIGFDLGTLSDQEKQRILSSSAAKPVSLVLLALSPTDHGAPVCFSRFQILRVE